MLRYGYVFTLLTQQSRPQLLQFAALRVCDGYDDPVMAKEVLLDGFFQTWDIGAFDEYGFPIVPGHASDAVSFGKHKGSPEEVGAVTYFLARHATFAETAEAAVWLSGGAVFHPVALLVCTEPEPAKHKLPEMVFYSG